MPSEYLPTRAGRRLVEADEVEQRVDALRRHAHGLGGDGERLAAAAPGVLGGGVEQHADAPARVGQVAVARRRGSGPRRCRAQEGLTNARKHAPGAAAVTLVRAPDGGLEVEVRSLAPVAVAAAAPLPGAGTGLIGLAERVTLAGGEARVRRRHRRRFVLRARLPR